MIIPLHSKKNTIKFIFKVYFVLFFVFGFFKFLMQTFIPAPPTLNSVGFQKTDSTLLILNLPIQNFPQSQINLKKRVLFLLIKW
ncbi:hypothetical protein LEP1GSC041_2273 [Leptospira noguchii str. 2006001870]|nr:hypothetical protein LEP1GSC041_2273 [Leptospira noguchii str. 2006001870]